MSSQDKIQTVVVIGAGTSGIVTAKYLLSVGVAKVRILERHSTLGGVFKHGVWKNAEMVSSKYVTSFSDYTMDEWWAEDPKRAANHGGRKTCPVHLSTANYAQYLEDYAKNFGVFDLIEFEKNVENVEDFSKEGGGYNVQISQVVQSNMTPGRGVKQQSQRRGVVEDFHADAVLVCSGLHQNPRVPEIWKDFVSLPDVTQNDGLVVPEPPVIHSQYYKSQAQIPKGGRVLIVGGGETAHDIAAQAVEGGAGEIFMSLGSDGYLAVPKEMFGKEHPLDVVIANAFEHFGDQSWVHSSHLRWRCMTPIIRTGFLIGTGSSHGYNQLVGRKKKVERGRHFIMKTGKALPYLNRPVALRHWTKGYPWRWAFPLGDKGIETLPMMKTVKRQIQKNSDGLGSVVCTYLDEKTGEMKTQGFDKVILCTGYSPSFPFLNSGGAVASDNKNGFSRDSMGGGVSAECGEEMLQHWPPTKRNIASPDRYDSTLAFIGFIRPNVGAIPPMAELQAMWWVHFHILQQRPQLSWPQRDPLPSPTKNIKNLPGARYTLLDQKKAIVEYGSDFGSYMFQVGEDMNAVPDLWRLLKQREWNLIILTMFGQSYTQIFRIHGPFASEKVKATARGMVKDTIWHRGLVANLILFTMTTIFGCINIWLLVLQFVLRRLGFIR